MKKLFLLLSIVPILAFSQISHWRGNSSQQSSSVPRMQSQPAHQNGVSSWRTETAPIRPGHFEPSEPLVRRYWSTPANPYGLYYGTWGWYQPYPYYWNDPYGWRHKSVIRIYENGKIDTIQSDPLHYTVGLGHTNNNQASFWGTIGGKKSYFIMDYTMSYDIDRNQYFPYGQLNMVDFPLNKNDFIKQGTFYLGAGKRSLNGKWGVHGMIGFGHETIRYQGRDALGGISFPKSDAYFTTCKFGVLREFGFFTLKVDRDPIRNYNQISIGLGNL